MSRSGDDEFFLVLLVLFGVISLCGMALMGVMAIHDHPPTTQVAR